jgi:hypothetical protein
MVYLPLTLTAAHEAIRLAQQTGCAVWVGADALTQDEFKQFIQKGLKITRFDYPLSDATEEDIASAIATIEEHHPGDILWVQRK